MLTPDDLSKNAALRLIVQSLLFSMFLLTTSGTANAKGPKGKQPSTDVCDYVLKAANQNRLDGILVPSEPYDSSKVMLPSNHEEHGIYSEGDVIYKQLLDINNDGKPERVFVTSNGSLQLKDLIIVHAKRDEPMQLKYESNEEMEQWESDISFVNFRGTTYLIGRNDLSLAYVAYLNQANEMTKVCHYGQEEESFRKIITSRDKELCDRYLHEEPQQVEYNKLHSLTRKTQAISQERRVGNPGESAALLDINNDGIERLVVSLNEDTSNACGSFEYPAVLSPDRTRLDAEFNKLLPEYECRTTIFPFIDKGKTYLGTADYRYRDDGELKLRKIDMLERGVIKQLCEYEVRPVNYILTPEQEIKQAAESKHADVWNEALSRPGTDAVQTLIKAGLVLNEEDRDTGRELPLIDTIRANRLDILELLLKAGANPSQYGSMGSPLQEAIRLKSQKAIEMLLRYGADPSDESRGNYTAIVSAVSPDDLNSLRLLLEAGSAITDTAAIDVILSNQADRHDKLRLLLAYGLDPNRQYARDELIEGITQEKPGVFTVGPDITMKLASKTLMEWAKESGDAETMKILAEAQKRGAKGGLIQRIRKADDELNHIYKLLTVSADKNRLTTLKKQQRDWLQERDKRCGSAFNAKFRVDWLRNAAAQERRGQCVLEATRRRTDELTQLLVPELYLPQQSVAGRSQSDWSKEYWRWSKSYPKGQGPSDDPSGALCANGQPDQIWFLAGNSNSKPVRRQCTVPAGRPIFFPVLASHAEAVSSAATCNTLQGMLNGHTLSTKKMQVMLDGKQLPEILPRWRQSTDCFKLHKADGERLAASDGYWLALKPLLPGKHTLKFKGEMKQDGFSQDVYYDLLVQ